MNRAAAFLMVVAAFACQPVAGEQGECPPPNTAVSMLTAKQLVERAIRRVEPTLPNGFGRIDASVVVTVSVDEQGAVTCARATKESHPILRKYCEEAARQWRFRPLLVKGKPVGIAGPIVFVVKR